MAHSFITVIGNFASPENGKVKSPQKREKSFCEIYDSYFLLFLQRVGCTLSKTYFEI